jgi:acyl carrier protein
MNQPLGVSGNTGLRERLRHARAGEHTAILQAHLQAEIQRTLSLAEPIRPDVGFFELNMSSLTAVELRNHLQEELGDVYFLQPTLLFDYPSIAKLAAHLAERIGSEQTKPTLAAVAREEFHQATETELNALLDAYCRRHA